MATGSEKDLKLATEKIKRRDARIRILELELARVRRMVGWAVGRTRIENGAVLVEVTDLGDTVPFDIWAQRIVRGMRKK
jgi:hypothetical protein